MAYKILYLATILVFVGYVHTSDVECPPTNETCEYWFHVKEKLTMIYHKDLVYPHGGKLYKYDESPTNATTAVSELKCLVVTSDQTNPAFF